MSLFLNPGEQEKMILQNYRLVYFIIKKLNIAQDQYEDIVSIGTIGLIKAVNTFDIERNIRFSTYAGRCIENEILMYMRKEKKHNADISLDETITTNVDGNTLKVGDLISISRDFTEDIMISEIVLKCISIILNRLTEKERLIMLYKIADINQNEAAEKLNISQSYASRLEVKTTKKVKRYLYNGTEYIEIFKVKKIGEMYQISFSPKDVKQFNNIFETYFQDTTNKADLHGCKWVNKNGQIKILISVSPRSFAFIANIIKKIDDNAIKLKD